MLNHKTVRVGAGFFTEFSVNRNVAAQQRLQRRANIADDAARSDHDAADDAEIFPDALIGNLRDGRDKCRIDHCSISFRWLIGLFWRTFNPVAISIRFAITWAREISAASYSAAADSRSNQLAMASPRHSLR